MAKAGDKKRLETNAAHLRQLQVAILAANVFWLVFRVLLRWGSRTWTSVGALALTSVLYAFCYNGIAGALAPHYSASGELIYSGADLSQGGVLSYYHDGIYLALFFQFASAFTKWAWLILLTIPAYGGYVAATQLLPLWRSSSKQNKQEPLETEQERKRREKKERQAARAQKFTR